MGQEEYGVEDLKKKDEQQYFNGDYIENLGEHWVAWVDIMGVLDHLQNDQEYPSIIRGELVSVISQYTNKNKVDLFTVGDGVILATQDQEYLFSFLEALFTHYVRWNHNEYRGTKEIYFARLLRAGVGEGKIYKINVEKYNDANRDGQVIRDDFANRPFGPGMIRALEAEKGAPYSIHIHKEDGTIESKKWWDSEFDKEDRRNILAFLRDYFKWYDNRPNYRFSPFDEKPRYNMDYLELSMDFFDVDKLED